MITLLLHSDFPLSRQQSLTHLSTLSLSVSPSVLDRNAFWQRSWGSLFLPDRKILAFTSQTCSVGPSPCLSIFFCTQLLCWSPDTAAASEEQEMKLFFPSNLSLMPFITQKPWFPAMAVSHSPNELILHEGRIPSYLCREGPLLSLTHSLSLLHCSLLLRPHFI